MATLENLCARTDEIVDPFSISYISVVNATIKTDDGKNQEVFICLRNTITTDKYCAFREAKKFLASLKKSDNLKILN